MCKKLIYLTCLVLIASMTGSASAGLIAQWKLDDGSGTVAKDSAGGYDGTLVGDTMWVAEGKLGGALQFDGNGDYVDCGNDPIFNPQGSFSITFWANISDWGDPWGRSMIGKGGDADRGGWSVRRFSDDTIDFCGAGLVGDGSGTEGQNHNMNGNTAPPIAEWFHLACVYDLDNSMAYIYINGEADRERVTTGTITATNTSLYLGTRGNSAGDGPDSWVSSFFNGMLDDARFYDHALTETDVRLIMEGKSAMPLTLAANPKPGNNFIEIPRDIILSWRSGIYANKHDVYFGQVFEDVNEADTTNTRGVLVSPNQDGTTYDPEGLLEFNQTYYWRVDEVNDMDPNSPWRGSIWSFTTANFTVVDDFEDYNDVSNRIYDVWADYYVNNTGMTVGHFEAPFAEQDTVHRGSQSMYMRYDNDGTVNEGTDMEKTGTLLYSETERAWETPQDWTKDGATSLTLWLRGLPAPAGSFTATATGYTMTGAGADIWDRTDSFHYAYKQLTGAGGLTAKVVSMTNTNGSAKAGVMIRESLEPDSAHAMVDIQPINEIQFLRRLETDIASEVTAQSDVSTPVWVKLNRVGNNFTGRYSIDGTNWITLGTVTIPMSSTVYIGFVVCSHDNNATCVAEFSNISNIGSLKGDWQSQDIGIESNIPEPMYIILEDSSGNSAVVKNQDANISASPDWTEWNIPFDDFTGVNMQTIKKIFLGVGDRANSQAGGAGDLYIDDIRLYRP
jgi:regulation of enolase protein 1 (concanavalin A-like superfamily)